MSFISKYQRLSVWSSFPVRNKSHFVKLMIPQDTQEVTVYSHKLSLSWKKPVLSWKLQDGPEADAIQSKLILYMQGGHTIGSRNGQKGFS